MSAMEARQIGHEARFGDSESTGLCWLERVLKSGAGREGHLRGIWEGLRGEVGMNAVVFVNESDELEREWSGSGGVRELSRADGKV